VSQIDKLIETIGRFQAERLIVSSGEKIALTSGGQSRLLTDRPVTSRQIEELLKPIVPSGRAALLDRDGEHEFDYASPSGPVTLTLTRASGSLRLLIGPKGAGASPFEAGAVALAPAAPAPAPGRIGAADAPAIDRLFRKMVEQGCSDLHLTSGNPPLFRKDGEIVSLGESAPLSGPEVSELLRPIAKERHWREFETAHDTDFSYEITGLARFRCNLFMDRIGPGGVFRVIPSAIPTAEQLGLPKAVLELCHLTKGFVVVTGPTGSGKSTTLASMVDYINKKRADHIITIEDPIEFVHPKGRCLINQREVGIHTGGFKPALRAALREDPDIVLVGEMRDLETVAIAIETAETGHLVFGTLHTNSAPSTVDRIIDQFPADRQSQVRTMLSESLKGVIAQTLCRKAGGGRVAALEILLVNPAVSNLIREGKTYQIPSIMQTGKALGMITMNDWLLELIRKKIVDPEEAIAKSYARADLRAALERAGLAPGAAPIRQAV